MEHFIEYKEPETERRVPEGAPVAYILLSAVLVLLISVAAVFAQTATGTGVGTAVSGSAAQSASVAGGGSVNINTVNRTDGTQRIESAPAVSAPAVFGGGHPCLAGKSGGISVVGGGFSYGQGNPEPACMAWIMGNPMIALDIMFSTSPAFKTSACRIGYFQVGSAKIPVRCDGASTTASASAKAPSAKSAGTGYSKCALEGGVVKIRYTAAGRKNKDVAKKNCMAALGY